MSNYRYLFGPVPSRRLGRSLGVDLLPFKTCSMDCVYCQLGRTSALTGRRAEYVPVEEVFAELDRWEREGGTADCVTLSGSGEPTLHLRFGEVLRRARAGGRRAVLLTNGSLLHFPDVREAAAEADVVKITLSAWDESSFRRLHRPAPGRSFGKLVEGARAFRREFSGELWLEVFLVEGINDAPEEVGRIARIAETIRPDRIDLNTAVRPPAEADVKAVPPVRLAELADLFTPPASIPTRFRPGNRTGRLSESALLELLRRHPATAAQVADDFAVSAAEAERLAERLLTEGKVRRERRGTETYYFVRDPAE